MGEQRRIQSVRFRDRFDAGHVLAVQLAHYAGRAGTVVLGVPRGGLAVAYPIARTLSAPLDALLARKLTVSRGGADVGVGVVAPGGVRVIDGAALDKHGVEPDELDHVTTEASLELARLEHEYHGDHDRVDVRGHTVIVVDEALPTSDSITSSIMALRQQGAARVVVAVPVAAAETCRSLAGEADEVVWVVSTDSGFSPAAWYEDFDPVSDEVVRDLLERGREDARTALALGWQRSSAPSFTSLSPERA